MRSGTSSLLLLVLWANPAPAQTPPLKAYRDLAAEHFQYLDQPFNEAVQILNAMAVNRVGYDQARLDLATRIGEAEARLESIDAPPAGGDSSLVVAYRAYFQGLRGALDRATDAQDLVQRATEGFGPARSARDAFQQRHAAAFGTYYCDLSRFHVERAAQAAAYPRTGGAAAGAEGRLLDLATRDTFRGRPGGFDPDRSEMVFLLVEGGESLWDALAREAASMATQIAGCFPDGKAIPPDPSLADDARHTVVLEDRGSAPPESRPHVQILLWRDRGTSPPKVHLAAVFSAGRP